MISTHLPAHVLIGEHRVQTAIDGSVDISRKVGTQIIYHIQHQVIGQFIKNIPNHLPRRIHGCIPAFQRINESIARFGNMLHRSPVLALEEQEGFVLDT